MGILGIAKVLLDIVKEILPRIGGSKKQRNFVDLGSLLTLYGSAARLAFCADKVSLLLDDQQGAFSEEDVAYISKLLSEVNVFTERLLDLHMSILGFYYPGLAHSLLYMIMGDFYVVKWVQEELVPKHNILERDVPKVVDFFCRLTDLRVSLWQSGFLFDEHIPAQDWSTSNFGPPLPVDNSGIRILASNADGRQALAALVDMAKEAQVLIGEVVSDNWSFKELSTGREVDDG